VYEKFRTFDFSVNVLPFPLKSHSRKARLHNPETLTLNTQTIHDADEIKRTVLEAMFITELDNETQVLPEQNESGA